MLTNATDARGQGSAAGQAEALCRQGFALHQQGRLDAARELYEQTLEREPHHFNALHLLGLVALQSQEAERAAQLIGQALRINPHSAAAHCNHGNALRALGRFEAAIQSYDQAIALKPDFTEAHYNRANALRALQRYEEAVAGYTQAIALKPDHAEAYNNRGLALCELKQLQAAIDSFERAIDLKPDDAEAYYACGLAFLNLQRFDAALACFDKIIALAPGHAEAYNNRGAAFTGLKRYEPAIASYHKAIEIDPSLTQAHYNCGNALRALRQFEKAAASYDRAIAINPQDANAHYGRGVALLELVRHEDALVCFDRAYAIEPTLKSLPGMRLGAKRHLCVWGDFDEELAQLVARVERGEAASPPLPFSAISGSPALQRRVAEVWVREECPGMAVAPILKRGGAQKIRIGYFSPDFRLHPVSILMAELFEVHDRERFEVYAFSYGSDTQDEMRVRLEGAFDRFLDVRPLTDPQIVALSRELQIDIAVDLAGFTLEGRPKVFAQRAAPVQVSYLGYAGTMGAPYMDYLIADRVLIPAGAQAHYREKILYMPESFMVNDSKRAIAEKRFSRAELMLPESGFVYCCFNNSYKIAPDTFSGWMRILRAVPDSVLWLPQSNATAQRNLRSEAGSRGVSAERLIFAPRLASMAEHLARLRVADLFLDTLPYNAHTTASDALWAGLPVLTCLGEAFAGRVAGSLLQALGLPELITQSPGEYEALAVQLGLNPERLAGIKGKLAANRLTQPLFDTPRFARHLEAAFAQIHARYQADLPPEHVYIEAQQSATPVPVETQDVCTVASHVD